MALFLLVFEPFGTDDFTSEYRTAFLLGYGLIIAAVGITCRYGLPLINNNFFDDRYWTVGKQILFIFATFVVAISGSYMYWAWFFEEPLSLISWWGFGGFGLAIGIFPIVGLITADYIFLLHKYQGSAEAINPKLGLNESLTRTETVLLEGANEGERLEIASDQLLYLQSASNYVEIFHRDADSIRSIVFRVPMKQLEDALPSPPWIRIHRSYLVNLEHVQRVSGNAQGHKLHIPDVEQALPVARGRADAVLAALTNSGSPLRGSQALK